MAGEGSQFDSDPLHYYSLLNLSPGATPSEIKENYQRLSLVLHPDKQPEQFREQATQQFTRLEEAKDVLLDPAKRFAYDHYGEAGLSILHQHRSKFANESWELSNPLDRRLFNEKIRRLIRQSNEQLIRSELNPRTDLSLSMSVAEYYDSNGMEPLQLKPSSVQLQEMVRFSLSPRLAGDIGFMVYTKGNLGVTVLTPRLYWSICNGLNAQIAAQVGDRSNSFTVALFKSYQDLTLSAQVGLSKNNALAVFSANSMLNRTTNGKIDLQVGANPQVSLNVKKHVWEHSSLAPFLRLHKAGTELGVKLHHRLSSHVSSFISCTGNVQEIKKGLSIRLSAAAGLTLKLTKFTKATYELEVGEGEIHAVFGIIRGGLHIRLPVALSNVVSFGNVLVGGIAIAICAYATNQLHSYFYEDSLKDRKKEKKKEQRSIEIEEARKSAEEYVMMIRSKALLVAQLEHDRKGLVILEAFYGKLALLERITSEITITSSEVFDVTMQLQVLVENHRLVMPALSKSVQYGFYNPCPLRTESLGLFIKFSYGGHVQARLFHDTDVVTLP